MIECWHFLRDDGRMRDGAQAEVGVLYTTNQPIVLCKWGYHGSRCLLDALNYAPGSLVCRVEIGGDILEDNDKLVGQTRRILWMFDATRVLHLWSCDVAERLLRTCDTADPRSWDVIRVKREWVDGQQTDVELDAAQVAAWAAARAAARAAAQFAAQAAAQAASQFAARDAAQAAAQAASRAAAWSVARSGAQVAAWYVAWAELSQELEERMMRESRS